MTSIPTIPTANPDQLEYWNSESGAKWITYQDRMDYMMGPLTERLLEHAAADTGERVVDVGCGTAVTTAMLAHAVGTTGHVLGVDISELMLALARQRAEAESLTQTQFAFADAQVYDFEAGGFDLVFSRFGVMFFDDPVAAFTNLATALRPQGRLCFACWAPLERNPWFRVPREIAARHLGPPAPQAPNTPGPFALADTNYVQEILAAAGFREVAIDTEPVALRGAATAEETAEYAAAMGPANRRIREVDAAPEAVRQIVADIAEAYRPYLTDDGIRVPARIHFISARKLE